jgi:hypothetical protein
MHQTYDNYRPNQDLWTTKNDPKTTLELSDGRANRPPTKRIRRCALEEETRRRWNFQPRAQGNQHTNAFVAASMKASFSETVSRARIATSRPNASSLRL